jgi:hypothetical protein
MLIDGMDKEFTKNKILTLFSCGGFGHDIKKKEKWF